MWLSGISGHGVGGLVSQWGRTIKSSYAHCHKSVAILIWPWMLPGRKTPTNKTHINAYTYTYTLIFMYTRKYTYISWECFSKHRKTPCLDLDSNPHLHSGASVLRHEYTLVMHIYVYSYIHIHPHTHRHSVQQNHPPTHPHTFTRWDANWSRVGWLFFTSLHHLRSYQDGPWLGTTGTHGDFIVLPHWEIKPHLPWPNISFSYIILSKPILALSY